MIGNFDQSSPRPTKFVRVMSSRSIECVLQSFPVASLFPPWQTELIADTRCVGRFCSSKTCDRSRLTLSSRQVARYSCAVC